jgi:phosphoglycolate phosphatase-like HAD superfamily hydrolase
MRRTVLLDLDGPILQCSSRYYACYADICREFGLHPLPREEYWELKRQPLGVVEVFRRSDVDFEESKLLAAWIERIEQPRYLAFDTVQPGVVDTLSFWSLSDVCIRVATLRRDASALADQLTNLKLDELLGAVAVCDPNLGGEGKAAAAGRCMQGTDPKQSVWIGDTEVDARAASILGCGQLYLVTCGIRSEAYLRSLEVGEIADGIPALRDRITASSAA